MHNVNEACRASSSNEEWRQRVVIEGSKVTLSLDTYLALLIELDQLKANGAAQESVQAPSTHVAPQY